MQSPYKPIHYMLASIFTSGFGFMLFGIWLANKISHDERILFGIGIAFIAIGVGFAIVSSIHARNQSSYDMGVIPPNSKL